MYVMILEVDLCVIKTTTGNHYLHIEGLQIKWTSKWDITHESFALKAQPQERMKGKKRDGDITFLTEP